MQTIQKQRPPLTPEEERMLCDLWHRCNDEQAELFMAKHGLYHASFLDPAIQTMNDDAEYIENNLDLRDMRTCEMVASIKKKLAHKERYLLVPLQNTHHWNYDSEVYVCADDISSEVKILFSAKRTNHAKHLFDIKMQQKYCSYDLYDLSRSFALALLPKMMEDFEARRHTIANGLTEKRWKVVMKWLIWFMHESIEGYEIGDKLYTQHNSKSQEVMRYQRRLRQCSRLLGKYWMDLVD